MIVSRHLRAVAVALGLVVNSVVPGAAGAQSDDLADCSLFSAADVAAVLGEPVVANNRFGCEYDSLPDTHPFKMIRFIPDLAAPDAFQARSQELAGQNGGSGSWTPIADLGDEAYAWRDDLGDGRLDLRSGAKSVEIFVDLGTFGAPDYDAKLTLARQLAAIAVDHFSTP
jgi:hypothetical protein